MSYLIFPCGYQSVNSVAFFACKYHKNCVPPTFIIFLFYFFFYFLVIFQKANKHTHTDVTVESKTDAEIFEILKQAKKNATLILNTLGVPVVDTCFEFKGKSNCKDNTDLLDLNEELAEDSDEGSVHIEENQHCDTEYADLEIIRKYCGNFIETCSPSESKNKFTK